MCTNKVDTWSMGCILYELAVGQKAFNDDFATYEYKRSAKELDVPLDETFNKVSIPQITEIIVCYFGSNLRQGLPPPIFSNKSLVTANPLVTMNRFIRTALFHILSLWWT
jgi:serine/threonine protein kinase